MTKDFLKGAAIGAGALLGLALMAWALEKLAGKRMTAGITVG